MSIMMNQGPLDTMYDTVESTSICVLHRPYQHDGSQRQTQQSLQAERPLSPWSSTADPEGMLSDYEESFQSNELNGTSDDGREPSDLIGNNEYNEADNSEFMTWEDETEQEEEHSASDTAKPGSLATVPVHSPASQGNVLGESSHAVSVSPNTCAEPFQATRDAIEASEQIGEQPRPGRLMGLKLSTDYSGIQPPSIVVSSNANDEVTDGDPPILFKSYNNVDLSMNGIHVKGATARPSERSMTPLQWGTRPGGVDGNSPNNYEMATQDRQPPNIPSGIDPQCEKIADRLSAFYADADSISADANATTYRNDADSPRVKRPRPLSGNHPVLQTPTNNLPVLQHWQKPSSNPRASLADQRCLQVPTYPTPPFSFQGSPEYGRHDSPFTTDSTSSTQPILSPNRSKEPGSPFSRSPSTLPEADDDIIRCSICANAVFKGPHRNNSLKRHERDKHKDMLRLGCLQQGCAVTFAPGRKDNLLNHVRDFHPDYSLLPPSKKRKRKLDSG